MAAEQGYHMYIVRCSDGSLYVDCTRDLVQRIETHNSGRGPIFTRSRLPVELVYSEPFPCMSEARQREVQIKKWSHAKKVALIAAGKTTLKRLSQRRR
jgi:putative endonuclease